MTARRARVLIACLSGLAVLAPAPVPEDRVPLDVLLDRLGRASLLYADTALRFSCDETLRAVPGGTFKDSYIYVYGQDGRFHDYRTRRGDEKGTEVPPDHVPIRRWLGQALSWVFQFRPERRGRIAFTLKGEETALGVPAVVIAFEPVPPIQPGVNDWFGTAWVDARTAQLLKVEAVAADEDGERREFEEARAKPIPGAKSYRWSTVTTEFANLTNGLRFPSLAVIETRAHTLSRFGLEQVAVTYRVEQIYDKYRFFSVRSAEEVQRLTGAPPATPP
jgi:hypothetical protein